jgi:4'-phosphopantetheinyl transferase EntD
MTTLLEFATTYVMFSNIPATGCQAVTLRCQTATLAHPSIVLVRLDSSILSWPAHAILLPDEEREWLMTRPDWRRTESLAGRLGIRAACRLVGRPMRPGTFVLPDRAGSPILPADLRGSIAHAGTSVLAAVTTSDHVQCLGVDIARIDRCRSISVLLHKRDRIPPPTADLDSWKREHAALLLTTKEAVIKAAHSTNTDQPSIAAARVELRRDATDRTLYTGGAYVAALPFMYRVRAQVVDDHMVSIAYRR